MRECEVRPHGLTRSIARAATIGLMCLSAGCSVMQLQQARISGMLRDRGVTAGDATVADAHVHYYRRDADGTPILFLHGFGASGLWQWGEQIQGMGERPVLMPDLLFFGRSRARGDFSLDHQVRVVAALLEELDIDQVHVIGVSYGGLVGYELAVAYPERVRSLTIVDSPGRAYTRADYDAMVQRFGVRDMSEVMIPSDVEGVRRLLSIAYADPPFAPDFALREVIQQFYTERRFEMAAMLAALVRDLDRLAARPDPTAPTMLVWGRDDPVFPLEIGNRLAARLDAPIRVIEHARHSPHAEHAAEFNALFLAFLESVEARGDD